MTNSSLKIQVLNSKISWADWDWTPIRDAIQARRTFVADEGDEESAKRLWVLEAAGYSASRLIDSFKLMKSDRYYEAWCLLEHAEKRSALARRHCADSEIESFLRLVQERVFWMQKLFPYRHFASPGYTVGKRECGICGERITPRKRCEHRHGEIYHGEICVHVLSEIEVQEVSIVSNPAQKYSVLFLDGKDYDYSVCKFAIARLDSPFNGFTVEQSVRLHPHEHFESVLVDRPCPCGRKEQSYKECCLLKDGVEMPHVLIVFDVPPRRGMSSFEYSESVSGRHLSTSKGIANDRNLGQTCQGGLISTTII